MSPKPIDPKDPDIHSAIESMQQACFELEIKSRSLMVVLEAMREKLCLTTIEVSQITDRYAREHKSEIREELGLDYKNGVFSPVGQDEAMDGKPELN